MKKFDLIDGLADNSEKSCKALTESCERYNQLLELNSLNIKYGIESNSADVLEKEWENLICEMGAAWDTLKMLIATAELDGTEYDGFIAVRDYCDEIMNAFEK